MDIQRNKKESYQGRSYSKDVHLENRVVDHFFDIVFSGETIEHIMDTDYFLSQINRIMPTGLPPQFSARYRSPHYRDFTLKTLRLALRNNGFEIEKAYGASGLMDPGIVESEVSGTFKR